MDALIFAAGKGERMRPLTLHTPKPLLPVAGKPLIEWHLERLSALGCNTVVINTSWLAECFEPALGDGSRWGLALQYTYEGEEPLETGGGMLKAMARMDGEAFIAINGDIFCDYDLAKLPDTPRGLAHLVMVQNPAHNPNGDFALMADGTLASDGPVRHTFAGIGLYRPELIWQSRSRWQQDGIEFPRFKLAPLLRQAMAEGQIQGELYTGQWTDVGTPERLAELDSQLKGL